MKATGSITRLKEKGQRREKTLTREPILEMTSLQQATNDYRL